MKRAVSKPLRISGWNHVARLSEKDSTQQTPEGGESCLVSFQVKSRAGGVGIEVDLDNGGKTGLQFLNMRHMRDVDDRSGLGGLSCEYSPPANVKL